MRLYRLPYDQQRGFSGIPEVGMGTHICRVEGQEWWASVVSGCMVATPEEGSDDMTGRFLSQPWLQRDLDWQEREGRFGDWLNKLPELPVVPLEGLRQQEIARLYMSIGVLPLPQPPMPPQPTAVYGHVPFPAVTTWGDVFYRFEAVPPPSRRIDQKTGAIAKDTFVSPASEIPFMPTGFSAVARCALPNFAPACFRWELRPQPGTQSRCGACVPQFGQSGGGVEVIFTQATQNIGPIANPVILPPL
jgi:hypothetical protein